MEKEKRNFQLKLEKKIALNQKKKKKDKKIPVS